MADATTATVRRDARGGVRLTRWLLTVVSVVVASFAGVVSVAAPAGAATAVSNVSLVIASPSSAAKALTTYVVSFKTSASGSLSGNAGATITVALPAATGVGSLTSSPVMVGATQVGGCQVNGGTTASCFIFNGDTVAANATVKVMLNGVTNPTTPAATYKVTVSTTSDTTAVQSPAYTVTAVGAVTGVSAVIGSPSSAAKALTTYVVSFVTSATGGLAGTTGSTISVALPATTGVDSLTSSPVMVGAIQVGGCQVNSGTTATCFIFNGDTVAANTTVKVILDGVTNPTTPAATYKVTVSTTSDTTAVQSPAYTVTAVGAVTGVSVAIGSPSSAAKALTTYVVSFTTSATGGLAGTTGSTISVALPAATGVGSLTSSPVMVGATQVGGCQVNAGTTADCFIFNGDTVAANTAVKVFLNGVTNPTAPAATYKATVSTTSDVTAVQSPSYTVTAVGSLTGLGVVIASPSSAAKALTTYVVSFTTSATGGLAGTTGSTISVALPAGTGVGSLTSSPVMVGATQVGSCQVNAGTTATCFIFNGDSIAANTVVKVILDGVTNPTAPAATYKVTVGTTSDTTAVQSPSYTVTPIGALTSLFSVSNNHTGATNVTYTVLAKTSATGGLAGTTGSTITVVLPAGTGVASLGSSPVMVGATQVGSCQVNAGTTATCFIFNGDTVAANTNVKIVLNGVTNPATTKAYTLALSSSSDTAVQGITYCIAATGVPCISGIAPKQGPIGQRVTITGVNLTGATSVKFHGTAATILTNTATQITTTLPAGATTGTITVVTGGGTATSTTFTVTTPHIALSPASGAPGTHVTATLTGFKTNQSVTVHWDAAGGTLLATVTTNSLGAATATFVVPAAAVNGNHTVFAIESGGPNTAASFNVTAHVALSPTGGAVGTHVTATLTGFKSNQSVTLHWDTQGGTVLATVTTNSLGSATTTFVVPAAASGNHIVYAIGSGGPNSAAFFAVA